MRVTSDLGSPVRRIRLDADGREDVVASAAGLRKLTEQVAAADADPACRLIVVAAGAGGFCRGMDLEAIAGADPRSPLSFGS